MLAAVDSSSVNLLLCLNEILASTITSNDWKIFAINFNQQLLYPAFRINLKDVSKVDTFQKPDVYLIDLDENILAKFIQIFYRYRFFNPRAKYIIFGSTISPADTSILASNFIVDVIFLNTVSWKIFTYFPYKDRMIWKTDHTWKEIMECDCVQSWEKDINLFEDKIPKIWTATAVSLGTVPYPPFVICLNCKKRGYQIDLYEEVLSLLNITVVFKELDYSGSGGRYVNFGRNLLFDKVADVILSEWSFIDMDYIYPYFHVYRLWVVASPAELPRWKYFFSIFSKDVLMYWGLSLMVILLGCTVADLLLIGNAKIFQKIWVLIKLSIEQSVPNRTNYFTQSLMIFLSFFLTFLMSATVKAGFPFLLTGFNFEKPIEDVADIMEHNLTIASPYYQLTKSFFSETAKMLDYFNEHFILCDFSPYCAQRLLTQRDIAMIITEDVLTYTEKSYRDKMGRSLIRKLTPAVMRTQLGSNMLKGNPIAKSVDKFFFYLDQHGIKKRFMSFYSEVEPYQIRFQVKSLTMEIMMFPLFVLILGTMIGVISFFVECAVFLCNSDGS